MFGLKDVNQEAPGALPRYGAGKTESISSSPKIDPRRHFKHQRTGSIGTSTSGLQQVKIDSEKTTVPIIARISSHVLRLEREYHLCKSFIQTSDPECHHTLQPVELIRLPGHQEKEQTFIVSIFVSPGRNYLRDLTEFGPSFVGPVKYLSNNVEQDEYSPLSRGPVAIPTFLNFAIGACECLELLHHGQQTVHGELRADAFHYNSDTAIVKLVNFGSGPRSFENGLTSSGWMALSRQIGAKHKLQFIAPEQTGRMPAEPNSRTDLYSLGILLWTLLTGKSEIFHGETPLDVRII